MKLATIATLLAFVSCSLMEKRRSDFRIEQGAKVADVLKKVGEPQYESKDGAESILTYDYCKAPYWKEAVFGLMTGTIYNWSCNNQRRWIQLHFNGDGLYKIDDAGTSPALVEVKQK